jgi:hypothetical protein
MPQFISSEQRKQLIELYVGYFNRAPEAGGLSYWVQVLLGKLGSGVPEADAFKQIADSFYSAGVQFGIFNENDSIQNFITKIYKNVLGRDTVDPNGMTYWVGKLQSGEVSKGQFVRQLIAEARAYVDAAPANDPYKWVGQYLDNRVAVGEWFASNSQGLAGQNAINTGTSVIANSVTPDAVKAGQTAQQAIQLAQLNFAGGSTTVNSNLLELAKSRSHKVSGIDRGTLLPKESLVVQALDSGYHWNKNTLTYSYNTSIPPEYQGIYVDSTISGNLTTGWRPVSQPVRDVIAKVMSEINQLTQLSVAFTSGVGDIRFNMVPTNSKAVAFAYYPGSSAIDGDVFIDTSTKTSADYLGDGGYGKLTIVHEMGHALGLKHPFEDGTVLPLSLDHRVNSIMSYTDFKYLRPVFFGSTSSSGVMEVSASYSQIFPDGFMVYDIAALQSIYGANATSRSGDDVYRFDERPFYHTIYDAGGVDTLDLSQTTHPNVIRLSPGSYSDINYRSIENQILEQQNVYRNQFGTNRFDSWVASVFNDNVKKDIYTGEKALGIAFGVVIENAIGGSADDIFYDNGVDNILVGNGGNDVFYIGAGGFDTIDGGVGVDKVVCAAPKANFQIGNMADGSTLLVGDLYAARLIGVEQIVFSDQIYIVA